MNKKLVLFGPYPPPLGGISVHVKRITPFLEKENIDYVIYNHGYHTQENVIATKKKLFWYVKLLFLKSACVFHFHQFFFFHYFYYFLFSKIRKEEIIVTIHSERLLDYKSKKKALALYLLSKTKKLTLISVSKNLNVFLAENNINSIFLPAYVPPSNFPEHRREVEGLNGDLFLFSVWKFTPKLAKDVYNAPLVFEFLKRNKEKLTMLFMIGTKEGSDVKYLEKMLISYGVKDNVKLVFDQNLVEYVHNCRFLVRPNLKDGYGVSIQEAMDLGVPAIASNVCERPKGTILFENNHLDDFSKKIEYVLNTPKQDLLIEKEELMYHQKLIDLYLRILKK